MSIEITDKLVDVRSGEIIGYLVSAGGQYKVAVTEDFGREIGVVDIYIADFYDVPVIEVVSIIGNRYAVVERSLGFIEEYADVRMTSFGNDHAYWGYLFKDQHIVPFNSSYAVERMLREVNGGLE